MCTASWWFAADGGYELFFNRDELKRRAPGLPPREFRGRDGVRSLAPFDGERGGTWLAANEHGLTVCLINHYPQGAADVASPPPPARRLSRGELTLRCADAKEISAVESIVDHARAEGFAPFFLLALAPGSAVRLFRWDGAALQQRANDAVTPPVTSSSFQTERVIAARHETFARIAASASPGTAEPLHRLRSFHEQHDPARGAYSVCMNRPDASTVSFTHVRVTPEVVTLRYEPVSWSATGERIHVSTTSLELSRATAAAAGDARAGDTAGAANRGARP